ncbi:MAG: hypothetical protein K0B37_16670, partial [Bacteroidales bacterium]|nr:hypothetical protein [Bacteroidales bacterium]
MRLFCGFLILWVSLLLLPVRGWGQVTFSVTYDLAGGGNNVTSFSYNGVEFAGIEMGNLLKVGIISTSSNNNFRGSNWPLGATDGSDDFTGAVDLNKYIGFSIESIPGYTFTVTSIIFGVGRSATGPRQWQWRGSENSFVDVLEDYGFLPTGITNESGVLTNPDLNNSWTSIVLFPGIHYENLTGEAEFRLYGFNAEQEGGTGGLQGNITINGYFKPVSGIGEPNSINFDNASNWT